MIISKSTGHDIYYDKDKWRYIDTDERIDKVKRPCKKCGKYSTKEGHDSCLGILPGVMNACCGHGVIEDVYIQLLDGKVIKGKDAITIINVLRKYR